MTDQVGPGAGRQAQGWPIQVYCLGARRKVVQAQRQATAIRRYPQQGKDRRVARVDHKLGAEGMESRAGRPPRSRIASGKFARSNPAGRSGQAVPPGRGACAGAARLCFRFPAGLPAPGQNRPPGVSPGEPLQLRRGEEAFNRLRRQPTGKTESIVKGQTRKRQAQRGCPFAQEASLGRLESVQQERGECQVFNHLNIPTAFKKEQVFSLGSIFTHYQVEIGGKFVQCAADKLHSAQGFQPAQKISFARL